MTRQKGYEIFLLDNDIKLALHLLELQYPKNMIAEGLCCSLYILNKSLIKNGYEKKHKTKRLCKSDSIALKHKMEDEINEYRELNNIDKTDYSREKYYELGLHKANN